MKRIVYIFTSLLFVALFLGGCSKKSEDQEIVVDNPVIVWLGDSITQGSLGHDGDNLANAPTVKLANMSGCDVEGYGFYGNVAHDILWRYRDETQENQSIDPQKVYIFWIGSNDWAKDGTANADTQEIMDELEHFITYGEIDKYIVMGTTARYELRQELDGTPIYDIINRDLQGRFNDHYMDTVSVIGPNGYGPDDIHLTQEAYDSIAKAVYDKLKDMDYVH